MKKVIILYLFVLSAFPACASLKKPFLYSAESGGKKIIFIGTIHAGVSAHELPSVVSKEMAGAKVAFFEIDIVDYERLIDVSDDEAVQRRTVDLYFRKEKNHWQDEEPILSQKISPKAFAKLKQLLSDWQEANINQLNPKGAVRLVNQDNTTEISSYEARGFNPWYAMDYRLMQQVHGMGIRVFSLDREKDTCSEEIEKEDIRQIEEWANGKVLSAEQEMNKYRALEEAYRSGDERALSSAGGVGVADKCILDQRNRRWAEMVGHYLVKGEKAFVAVGAMHLIPGKYPSLLELLKKQGYTISRIVP